ncbi:carbohydrate ABC transporter permease [Streptomyces sp. wa22]|uniref:carbohydrate ABC transporter permease n=1 Tax=Streptomyces sp. wa22 TaxID=1828244 RepID=UPI0011C7FA99|nr:carbohydrate ABC transporter permease [Streptomyces sp. wa22]TXS09131.1 carbohydrate ABC transporter permease [Streptomyces sp. wa22]
MAAETPVRTLIAPAEMNRRTGRFLYRFVLVATLTGFTVAFVFPLYWMTTGAVKSSSELADQNLSLFPRSWHPESYADAWTNVGLGQFFLNTLLLAFGAWLTQLLIDVSAAYALSKLRPVLGNVVLGMMLAFNIFILKRFFDQIPVELLDSARIDGAGTLRVLISVVLPLSRPVLAVVSIFAVVGVWKDFLWPMLVLPDEAKQPITVALNRLSEFMPANQLLAGMVMASIPLLVLFLIFQRHIIAGLTAGSLKG